MKITMDKTYETQDGNQVRIYCIDAGGEYPVHGAYQVEDGKWKCEHWTADGLFRANKEYHLDLRVVKPRIKRTVWLNVYPDNSYSLHNTRLASKDSAVSDCIARVEVDIDVEQGHGLEDE